MAMLSLSCSSEGVTVYEGKDGELLLSRIIETMGAIGSNITLTQNEFFQFCAISLRKGEYLLWRDASQDNKGRTE